MVLFPIDDREINPEVKTLNKNMDTVLHHDKPIESHTEVKLSMDAGAAG